MIRITCLYLGATFTVPHIDPAAAGCVRATATVVPDADTATVANPAAPKTAVTVMMILRSISCLLSCAGHQGSGACTRRRIRLGCDRALLHEVVRWCARGS